MLPAAGLAVLLSMNMSMAQTIVGNDKDEHGCKGSAGYTWSSLKKECIQAFALPTKITDAKNPSFAIYVLFSADESRAEVFGVEFKPSMIMAKNKNGKYISENGQYQLSRNDKKEWELVFVGNIVGADEDEYGCKGSAGYTWSVVKNECIRAFELPVRLDDISHPGFAGYILFSADESRAEIFGRLFKPSLVLDKSGKNYVSADGKYVLSRGNDNKWTLTSTEVLYKQ